jgi:hypothetical protein
MVMPKDEYEIFEALNPFFEVVMEGLRGLVDGNHYFDTIAEDAFFEFRYHFPGWRLTGGAYFFYQCVSSWRGRVPIPVWRPKRRSR